MSGKRAKGPEPKPGASLPSKIRVTPDEGVSIVRLRRAELIARENYSKLSMQIRAMQQQLDGLHNNVDAAAKAVLEEVKVMATKKGIKLDDESVKWNFDPDELEFTRVGG